MTFRRAAAVLGALLAAWVALGLYSRARRAPRLPPPPGEMRGAWHVHTTRSDGRGDLDEVVRAARESGLQFVVVADHNVLAPGDAGWRDGVLVVPATEISAPYGHVVGIGISRELAREERQRDALGTVGRLGGEAVLAHPFHPGRPFTRWTRDDWSGMEVVSSDSFWGLVRRDQAWWRAGKALLLLPWDPGRSMLSFYQDPARELARYDAAAARRRVALFCASDAHGWPTYGAAFEAFSLHVPVAPTGDGVTDVAAVRRALLDGSAWCVLDALAPASGVRLSVAPTGDRIDLAATTPGKLRPAWLLFRDGAPVGAMATAPGGWAWNCGGPCPPGAWRVEGRRDGTPWVFTNPVWIE
ncbi:MAG: PHP domain-containing protein [Deltaproteobacteria bacterium]|nr:PHP domain-containing protein [Deltaproteobacteria bacterium]